MPALKFEAVLVLGCAALCLGLFAPPAHNDEPTSLADAGAAPLTASRAREGDVILRRRTGILSRAAQLADGDAGYSHAGIVVLIAGKHWVVHASPAVDGQEGGVTVAETIEDFERGAKAMALYRLNPPDTIVARLAAIAAIGYALRRAPFDARFDLTEDEKLYCTELVWRAFQAAGRSIADPGKANRFFTSGGAILLSQIQNSESLNMVARW